MTYVNDLAAMRSARAEFWRPDKYEEVGESRIKTNPLNNQIFDVLTAHSLVRIERVSNDLFDHLRRKKIKYQTGSSS